MKLANMLVLGSVLVAGFVVGAAIAQDTAPAPEAPKTEVAQADTAAPASPAASPAESAPASPATTPEASPSPSPAPADGAAAPVEKKEGEHKEGEHKEGGDHK